MPHLGKSIRYVLMAALFLGPCVRGQIGRYRAKNFCDSVSVGDSVEGIASEVRHWLGRVDLLVVSGGLGPTSDDVTREGVAMALDRSLRHDEAIEADLRRRFVPARRPDDARDVLVDVVDERVCRWVIYSSDAPNRERLSRHVAATTGVTP